MSSLGIGNIGSVHLAGSVSGGQQVKGERDQAKAEASRQDFKATLESLSNQHSENVEEASLSADRDADGRRMYDEVDMSENSESHSADDNHDESNSASRSRDAFGERGNHLDLDA